MLRLSKTLYAAVAIIALAAGAMARAGPERLREVPQSCKVVTQEDLRNAGQRPSVAETLKGLPTSPVACASSPPPQSSQNLSPFARDVLAGHNAARAAVGSPPLRWSPEIAAREQGWADELAKRGILEHSPRAGRGNVRENLARVPDNYTVEQTLGRWLGEMRDFVPGIFPNVCKSGGDCGGVLHYTQMVWFDTTDIGCGEARAGGFITMVCGYGPGGNKDGQQVGYPVQVAQNTDNATVRPVSNVDTDVVRTAPLFDLGLYSGGAWSSDWFPKDPDEEFWASSAPLIANLSEDTRLELGSGVEDYAAGDAIPYNGGIFWDPVSGVTVGAGASFVDLPPDEPEVDTKVATPTLPNAEVYKPSEPPLNPKYREFIQKHWDNVMKMADGTPYEKALSGFSVGYAMYQEGRMSCNEGLKQAGRAQAEGAIEALKQMKAQMSETGEFSAVQQSEIETTIEDYESLMNAGKPGPQKVGATDDSPTKVQTPDLPTKEVYNPADAPKCMLDVM